MSTWWMRVRELLSRDRPSREVKPAARPSGKSGSKPGAQGDNKSLAGTTYLALGLALAILVLHLFLFLPVPRQATDFPAAGEVATREIRAPFSFQAPLLRREVEMRRLEAVVVESPVLLNLDAGARTVQGAKMEIWLESLAAVVADSASTVDEKAGLLSMQYPMANSAELRRLMAAGEPDSLVPRLERAWRKVMQGGVADMLPPGKYDKVVVLDIRDGGQREENLREVGRVVAQVNLGERLISELRTAGLEPRESVIAASVMRHFVEPNLEYSPTETQAKQDAARQAVPTNREFIRGERIVDRGVRVTQQQAGFLEELEDLIVARGGGDDGVGKVARILARSLLIALALALYVWLARIHFAALLPDPRFLIALAVILGVFLLGASFALNRPGLGPMGAPIVLLSLLTTVLFKDKVGYTSTLLAVMLLAVLPDIGAGAVFAWFILGMVTVLSVRRIQKRSQFYQTILLLTFLSVVMIFLMGPGSVGSRDSGHAIYLVGLFAPVLSVAFGLFLLPVVEPMVGACSDLTLLELSDLNHPLLQRMALEAQGTYHHSQVVGQLAEHAARAIDANALLTRVGALFHDIGKMEKSEYYVENQRPSANKHDELSPSMSALVIAAHVKEGIELARRWRLPQQVIDFIPEHHGTMVMEYFYHKALEAESNETVKVDDFRYPGPKPHSRETAILMCADAVEAATRSLAKPTPSRIKEITKQIIDKRMLTGELDESGLSLSDIARIRAAFIPLLTGIHHSRIQYPGQKERESERPAERKGDRKART